MMKKLLLVSLLAGLVLTITACRIFNLQSDTQPPLKKLEKPASALTAYFPQQKGTTWFYEGFAEYAHRMTLVSRTDNRRSSLMYHQIAGQVADMSDGASKRNFNFRIQYLFTRSSIYERIIQSDTPFPHRIKNLQLLTLPLKKGGSWRQKMTVDGKRVELKAEIMKVERKKIFDKPIDTVTVRYRVPMKNMPGGVYEEIRVFARGLGVYSFKNTFGPNEGEWFNYILQWVEKKK
jgi:hypothetical protein